jgi:hypothetical protein
MSNDYEIFEGKTLSDVFKDIYDNSKTNKQQLEVLMKEVVGFIKDGDTAVQIIPMLKEYLEINVKNDEQVMKIKLHIVCPTQVLVFIKLLIMNLLQEMNCMQY